MLVLERFVWARHGRVWQAWRCMVWRGAARSGELGNGSAGKVLWATVSRGLVMQGVARRGTFDNPTKKEEMMPVYRWKMGARIPVAPQTAGEVCASLERDDVLTPKALVDASRPEDAPLHKAFEWNDAVAAERYREAQAGHIIRSIEVEIGETSEPTRAFVVKSIDARHNVYEPVEVALSRSDSRDELLRRAKAELETFKRKYAQLVELAEVFSAIETLEVA